MIKVPAQEVCISSCFQTILIGFFFCLMRNQFPMNKDDTIGGALKQETDIWFKYKLRHCALSKIIDGTVKQVSSFNMQFWSHCLGKRAPPIVSSLSIGNCFLIRQKKKPIRIVWNRYRYTPLGALNQAN